MFIALSPAVCVVGFPLSSASWRLPGPGVQAFILAIAAWGQIGAGHCQMLSHLVSFADKSCEHGKEPSVRFTYIIEAGSFQCEHGGKVLRFRHVALVAGLPSKGIDNHHSQDLLCLQSSCQCHASHVGICKYPHASTWGKRVSSCVVSSCDNINMSDEYCRWWRWLPPRSRTAVLTLSIVHNHNIHRITTRSQIGRAHV